MLVEDAGWAFLHLYFHLSCNERTSFVGEPCPVLVCPSVLCLAPVPFLACDLFAHAIGVYAFLWGQQVSR